MTPRRGLGVAAVVGVLLVLSGHPGDGAGDGRASSATTRSPATPACISPYTLVDGVVAGVLGAESSVEQGPPGALGTAVFAAVAVLLVAGCYAGLVARYRKALVMSTVELEQVSRWFGNVVAVNDVTMQLGPGRHRAARPQRRRQVHADPHDGRVPRPVGRAA